MSFRKFIYLIFKNLFNFKFWINPLNFYVVFITLKFLFFKHLIYPIFNNEIDILGLPINKKRAFVVGNGPSIKNLNFDKLTNEITFCSNKIYLLKNKFKWRPTFYTVEDYLVLRQNADEIRSYSEECISLFPHLSIKDIGFIKNCKYFNFNSTFPKVLSGKNFIRDGLPWLGSVVHTQILLAISLGYKEIFLLGVDFNFTISKDAKKNKKVLVSEGEVNHFSKNYRKKGEVWKEPNLALQEKGHMLIKKYCEDNGIKIFNLTPKSKLKIYKTQKIEKFIK